MNDYKVIRHYVDSNKRIEDVILEYFSIYLDINEIYE